MLNWGILPIIPNMNRTQKENLRELLITGINTYNPEWIELCEEANEMLDLVIDSVSGFSDECKQEDPKEEALREISEDAWRNSSMNPINQDN